MLRLCLRPSHADLPCISTPPMPRKELDEGSFSDDGHLLGACEHLSDNSDISHQLTEHVGAIRSATAEVLHHRLSGPAPAEPHGFHKETPPCPHRGRPRSHRKAHGKTDRRKKGSDHSPAPMASDSDPESLAELRRQVCMPSGPGVGSEPPQPSWSRGSWQEGRRASLQQLLPLDRGHLLDQTIEEVSVVHDCDVWFLTREV